MINSFKLVSQLTFPEKIIVWSIRYWVRLICYAKDPLPQIYIIFKEHLVHDAVENFDSLMRINAIKSKKPIEVKFPCCLLLGNTETEILASLAFSQNNLQELKEDVLNNLLPEENILMASKFIDNVAKIFTKVGLFFPIRDEFFKIINVDKNKYEDIICYKFLNENFKQE